ncbi:MAG: electron transfer flavoprotein subunit beta/FixA family protein [Clostridiaceae bacterium]|nr:electron transfer flavoprotein subunit beta/FixA family protein [Clostridiaceae bacterium]
MKILVCIKQVPGTSNVEVDPVTGVLKRDGIESKLNPYDLFSIELALRLKKEYDCDVHTITMGPPQAKAIIQEAFCMGADRGYVISDRKFAGADVLATSYTLSQGIEKLGKYDLIICGKQTTDGDTAQVGAEIAEFLEIPHVSNVTKVIEIKNSTITVKCNLENYFITQQIKLPCLICTDADINTPRLPSYKRRRELTKDIIEFISLKDLNDQDETNYGLTGSPTQVERIFPPEKSNTRQMIKGSNIEMADKLFNVLKKHKYL